MQRKQIRLTKFFVYEQNNSGGNYVLNRDKGIGCTVIIEAVDSDHADIIAKRKGIYFNGVDKGIDCYCCGDRWNPANFSYKSAPKWTPWGDMYIHFLDGKIFEIEGVK